MDKMREEFERWSSSEGLAVVHLISRGFRSEEAAIELLWQAWQASRKALVVELPNAWNDVCDKVMDAQSVKRALDAAGVAYK